ncbi:hypothetical protein CROQUDRAFT_87522 [Cronartium quercuum f. sp. fusiforme G11]|uniref:Reverse transcriptase n=1 Tax=Cronartium quercuum f. sp. fusiforme G11 TaxID=708437 RepID=A0A9P6NWB9_9BASI|nr:hypothetical protein CROQUDRAFT_87522 [Cronartium quercuum f. sp. fusiforme G11]
MPEAESFGFIDDAVMLTSTRDTHQLRSQMQTLSFRQNNPKSIQNTPTIDFGDRKKLTPQPSARWLGVTFDRKLTFGQQSLEVIAKEKQRAGFLGSHFHSEWGIPLKLLIILLSFTVHSVINYGVAAWLPLEPPEYFVSQLRVIDNLIARAALGALPSTPEVFLRHDFHLSSLKIRIQGGILNFISKSLTKPDTHPLFNFSQQAQNSSPDCYYNPFHRFFQHQVAEEFKEFTTILPIDPAIPLMRPTNYTTIIQPNKALARKRTEILHHSRDHVIVFTDDSQIPGKNTAAAAWCCNSNAQATEALGPASVILDNQSVIKELSSTDTLVSLIERKKTYTKLTYIHRAFPNLRILIRWGEGASTLTSTPSFSACTAANKEWASNQTLHFNRQEQKRLGHKPNPKTHLEAITSLKKHEVACITQLRSNHILLNQYLNSHRQLTDPACDCQEGVETVEHFLFICSKFEDQRQALLDYLQQNQLRPKKTILNNPRAFQAIVGFCNASWRLKSRWVWAKISDEATPKSLHAPSPD